MYTSLNAGALGHSLGFEESARLAQQYGFQGVQVDLGYLENEGVGRAKEVLERHGLRPGPFGLPIALYGDDDAYQNSVERLKKVAPLCAELGAVRSSTYIPSWHDELNFDENFAFHVQRLSEPASILKDHGIALGLEFLGPKTLREGHRYEFIYNISGMLELCEAIGTGNLGLLLDAWHWYTSGDGEEALKSLTKDQVVDVHINDAPAGIPVDEQIDNVRCLPGETGVIDIVTFLQALQNMGYEGAVTVEPFSDRLKSISAEQAIEETAQAIKKVYRSAGID